MNVEIECISLEETKSFSSLFLKYLAGDASLKSYYHRPPTPGSIGEQIKEKAASYSATHRQTMAQALQQQYTGLTIVPAVQQNLEALKDEKTFTVTTGHQLNIFTGPLYFIYKIATVVDACRQLKEQHPGYNFVPVYWMASEDHDLEEINHLHLYGRSHTWETDQTGPVGRMNTKGLELMLEGMPEKLPLFKEAYHQENLAAAVRYYVNALFGEYGVVVVDGDDADLKRLFLPVIEDDVLHHQANDLVEKATAELDALGYKSQIYPRKINFFYLEPGQRNRLVHEGDKWQVLNTKTTFTEEEIRAEMQAHPENFSPNVVLRPVYQEVILPNLAYVGGPAEVAYWLQLKGVFDQYQVPYPLVMPRNFGVLLKKGVVEKMDGLGLPITEFFRDEQDIVHDFVQRHSENTLTLEAEKEQLKAVYDQLAQKAAQVDATLEGRVGAMLTNAQKEFDKLEKRLEKSERDRQEVSVRQITAVKGKIFPNGKLQERYDNFLMYALPNPELIPDLIEGFNAFDYRMHIFKNI